MSQLPLFDGARPALPPKPAMTFDGATYEPKHDQVRLSGQCLRVFEAMKDGRWRTLGEIAERTGDQAQSISARLRDFRKERFGSHDVERRHRGDPADGLYEYRLIVNPETTPV